MTKDIEVVSFAEKLAQLDDLWSPRVVAAMNDVAFKVAKVEGDFVWHRHADTDEAFLVVEGVLEIELRDRTVVVEPGELFVVHAGVEHRPRSKEGASIVLIEPMGVRNTGDVTNAMTLDEDVWLV